MEFYFTDGQLWEIIAGVIGFYALLLAGHAVYKDAREGLLVHENQIRICWVASAAWPGVLQVLLISACGMAGSTVLWLMQLKSPGHMTWLEIFISIILSAQVLAAIIAVCILLNFGLRKLGPAWQRIGRTVKTYASIGWKY